jgi:FtsH-binding integral membrane protein
MNDGRRVTVGIAAFVLLCFFLPWLQVSCAGMKDSASGFDLARGRSPSLWIVPLIMLAIITLGLIRSVWRRIPAVFAMTGMVGGGLSAYLMYRERLLNRDSSMLVASFWTAWFWLGSAASVLLSVMALQFYAKGNTE